MAFIGKQPTKTAITSSDITDGVVTAAKLASDSVTTAKIADNGVTTAKINADAVTDAKIADDVVGTEHLTAGEVDTTALGADAVTAAKIADDAISDEHLDPTAITGQTAETSVADDDLVLVSDTSASAALRKMTVSNLVANAGGGGMTLLTSGSTTSTTSSIAITGTHVTSTYDHYKLYLSGKAEVDGKEMLLAYRNSSNNGLISSGYSWRLNQPASSIDFDSSTGDSYIRLTDLTYMGANTNEGFNMILDFMSPLSNTVPTMAFWKISGSNQNDAFAFQHGSSRRNDGTETHTGFTIFWSSGGDFDSFNYQFYGINKT